ncbi:uncharacterized protein VTP21DRAFT_1651 [Calcarisporiella thermophila]|uniref:uncharacterized protein n=1 Tax=Calcarisporiella thermophila TaxID=911321 RepID=UPI00374282E1
MNASAFDLVDESDEDDALHAFPNAHGHNRYDSLDDADGHVRSAGPTTTKVQEQVTQVLGIMQDNINKVMQRGDNLEDLATKTDNLHATSSQFRRGAHALRRRMWWKDFRMWILIGIVVIVLLIIIIVPIVKSSQG